jgi:riboflavin synthase
MFTGIITDIGTVRAREERGDTRLIIGTAYDTDSLDIGASIACSGVCLTVVERGGTAGDAWFDVDLSGESVSRTVPGMWEAGASLNLEPSLRLGDELGGHIVTGHVDSVGEVVKAAKEGGSWQIAIRARAEMAPFIAEKGSITVNGVSLTVNDVRDRPDGTCDFLLNIIPHTAAVTTLGLLAEGDRVNLEIDVLARYLKRMQGLAAMR